MTVYHIDKPDSFFMDIVNATFPSYNGKKFKISTLIPLRLDSYWSGGSKDSFAFYCLPTTNIATVKSNHPAFAPNNPSKLDKLPRGMLLVKHNYFRGKDMGITVYANKEDLTGMLPKATPVTAYERIVLQYTSGHKFSYAGIKNYRFHEAHRSTGITSEQWDTAKTALIVSKHLMKNGAITPKGRNTIAG